MSPKRRRAAPLLGVLALGALIGLGCVSKAGKTATKRPRESVEPAIPRTTVPARVGAQPAILSAKHREPTLAELAEGPAIAAVIFLVLSVEVEPSTVSPAHFLVSLADGRRRRPAVARLMLPDGGGTYRTVLLAVSRPEGAAAVEPLAVTITGPLFSDSGELLRDLAAEVEGPTQAPRLVQALRLPATLTRCPGAEQVVRILWSVPIAGGVALDPGMITLSRADGAAAMVAAIADHRAEPGPLQVDDNAIDLCVADHGAPVTGVTVAAGLVADHFGHENLAGEASVVASPRG